MCFIGWSFTPLSLKIRSPPPCQKENLEAPAHPEQLQPRLGGVNEKPWRLKGSFAEVKWSLNTQLTARRLLPSVKVPLSHTDPGPWCQMCRASGRFFLFFFFLSAAKLTNYSIDFTFDQKSGPLNEQGGDCATAIAADVGVSFNLFGGASEIDLRRWTWRTLP